MRNNEAAIIGTMEKEAKRHGVYTFDDALDIAEEIYNNVDLRSDNE